MRERKRQVKIVAGSSGQIAALASWPAIPAEQPSGWIQSGKPKGLSKPSYRISRLGAGPGSLEKTADNAVRLI